MIIMKDIQVGPRPASPVGKVATSRHFEMIQ